MSQAVWVSLLENVELSAREPLELQTVSHFCISGLSAFRPSYRAAVPVLEEFWSNVGDSYRDSCILAPKRAFGEVIFA